MKKDRPRIYLRLVLQEQEKYTESERETLSVCMGRGPGVARVHLVERHPRGGYTVVLEAPQSTLGAILAYAHDHGYRAAV